MVGLVSESTTGDHNQTSESKDLKYPLNPFDTELFDLSVTDSFVDFDSIREFFEDSPDPDKNIGERIEFGSFNKGMEMDDKGQTGDGSSCVVKIQEGKECITEGRLGCSIEEEMRRVSLVGGSNPVEGNDATVKSEIVSYEEDVGRVILVPGSSSVPDGSVVKSELVSNELEIGDVGLVNETSSDITNGSGVSGNVLTEKDGSGQSGSDSDSESGSSSVSSSASSSSDDDDDEVEEEEEEETEEVRVKLNRKVNDDSDVEEGEIKDTDEEEMAGQSEEEEKEEIGVKVSREVNEEEIVGRSDDDEEEEEEEKEDEEVGKMVGWSDAEFDEDDDTVKGPIRSENELKVLPPVPPVDVTLESHHQMEPVGVVSSIIGAQVIVEGAEKHNPLNEGSVLWVTEKRSPLGMIDEVFGPVENPFYVVRYNSASEVPSGINEGTLISFVPQFAKHVLKKDLYQQKGYDASGANDEEVLDDLEFSDDEKEAKYKRMLKMSKRGMHDQMVGTKKNNRKKVKNRDGDWKNNRSSREQTVMSMDQLPLTPNQQNVASVGTGFVQQSTSFALNTGVFPPTGLWANMAPSQQPHNTVIPGGFSANNMPFPPQNQLPLHIQMAMLNGMLFQQQFNPAQGALPNSVIGGQPDLSSGCTFSPWPGIVGQNCFNQAPVGMGFQVQPTLPTMNTMNINDQGMMPGGQHVEQNCSMQPSGFVPGNFQAPWQFDVGASSNRGRKSSYRRGGGRFTGGRGQQPPK